MITKDSKIPQHVAIIMDGNGRWAKKRFLPRSEGHRAGGKTLQTIIEVAAKSGVRYLTVFAFSTENWKRPKEEVDALMDLLKNYLTNNTEDLIKNNIRVRVIGDISRLSVEIQEAILKVESDSKDCSGMDFIVALSYGGRSEIVAAVQKIAQEVVAGRLDPQDISEETVTANMYLPEVPDPDLLIRTSGECRISNFLLWQLAYSEIVVADLCWPDFKEKDFLDCLAQYEKRNRRYGLTQEQIKES
ncbi:MAG: isoprenyl transferase [Bdellovibrionota bacterium]|jgi:undecaprenyl diphosphate synthase